MFIISYSYVSIYKKWYNNLGAIPHPNKLRCFLHVFNEDYVDNYNVGLADGILDVHFMNAVQVIGKATTSSHLCESIKRRAQVQYEKYRKIIDLLLNMKEDAE